MIHQSTHEAARRCYSFDRDAYDRAARARRCLGMGLGLGLGMSQPAAGGSALIQFSSFFTNVISSIQSDIGVTTISGGVSSWADQLGFSWTQGVSLARPTLTAGLNGFPGVLFDGVAMFLNSALDLPAPGTTPTFIWAVYRIISAPAGNAPIVGGDSTTGCFVYCPAAGKATNQYNGAVVNSNSGSAASNYVRGEFLFTNSASDYSKVGSTVVNSGTPAGNQDGAASRNIGGGAGNNFLNFELFALVHLSAAPSTPQKDAASAAVTAKYGASVQV